MSKRPGRLSRPPSKRSVSIVGAGRLGKALAGTLKDTGYEIRLVVNRRAGSARRAARALGSGTVGVAEDDLNPKVAAVLASSALIVISTPDDVIGKVATRLAELLEQYPALPEVRRTVLHTSGALSSQELRPLKRLGFATGSLHPLVSIGKSTSAANPFKGSYFCVEGDAQAVQAATSLARSLGGRTFRIKATGKSLYHAAAVMVAGNIVGLFDIAVMMLQRSGLSAEKSKEVLLPLMKSSVKNLETMGRADALTGPLARGDIETVSRHLAAMKSHGLSTALGAYVVLGQQALNLAARSRTPPANLKKLARLLAKA